MNYRFNLGDIVFMDNPDSHTNAGILHIVERETKRFDEDILPHKYYHGFAFGLAKDSSGLYISLNFFDDTQWIPSYKAIWSPNHKESELETINSQKVDLSKLFPYIGQL